MVVVVRQDGRLKPNELVTFHTSKGTLIGRNQANEADLTNKRVYGMTDGRGRAEVEYFQDPGEGSDTVTATISGTDPAYEREIVFGINGGQGTGAPSQPPPPPPPAAGTDTITISLSSTTGEPGDEIDVRVTSDPSGESVNTKQWRAFRLRFLGSLWNNAFHAYALYFRTRKGSMTSPQPVQILLQAERSVTVEAELGTLSITAIGTPEAGLQTFSISAVDADGDRASGPFTARLSGTGFTSRNVEIADGRGNARVTLPTAASALHADCQCYGIY